MGRGLAKPKHEPTTFASVNDPVGKAIQDLAYKLRITSDLIQLKSYSDVVWPNGSLGCPDPVQLYSAAQVPGYVIVLHYGRHDYLYQGKSGRMPFRCEHADHILGTLRMIHND